ncbi:MAG: hypothetical protein KBA95_12205 [Acidobacteria bacterium]|nr:hypothetical protein [Acidobacteriota bacterium]
MTKLRLALAGLVAVLVVLFAGYLWGTSGRGALEDRADALEARLRAAEAQRALAVARVDLFELNYGQASRHLEEARRAVERLAALVKREGPREALDPVQEAAGHTREAQQLLAQMDQAAGSRAASALQALDRALAQLPSFDSR